MDDRRQTMFVLRESYSTKFMDTPFSLKTHSIAAIVLAAGRGTRMSLAGASKLLLPMPDGRPVLLHSVGGALDMEPLETIVVVQPDSAEIEAALRGLPVRFVPNPRYREGMGASLAAGVSALSKGAEGVLVLLGDEPSISRHTVGELLRLYLPAGKPITIPRYGEHFGPPTLFSKVAFPQLQALEGDTGGRQLVARYPSMVAIAQLSADERPRDLDAPQDYRQLFGKAKE